METCDVAIVDDPERPGEPLCLMCCSGSVEVEPDPEFEESDSVYGIGLATSHGGLAFEPLDAARSRDGTFHMWTLCIKRVPELEAGVCHHTSSDGIDRDHHGLAGGLDRAFRSS